MGNQSKKRKTPRELPEEVPTTDPASGYRVDPTRVVQKLVEKNAALTFQNASLEAAVDQLQEELQQARETIDQLMERMQDAQEEGPGTDAEDASADSPR